MQKESIGSAAGSVVKMIAIGDIPVRQVVDGVETITLLRDVGYAPKCRTNLVSLIKAQRAEVNIQFESDTTKCRAAYGNRTVLVGDSETHGIAE